MPDYSPTVQRVMRRFELKRELWLYIRELSMPHDTRGNELKVGDRVTMTFEVTGICPGTTACNVMLQAKDPNEEPTGEYAPVVSCNARLTERVEETR
jgi:hypothetical protein